MLPIVDKIKMKEILFFSLKSRANIYPLAFTNSAVLYDLYHEKSLNKVRKMLFFYKN